jgi:hypothetical protein
LHELPHCGAAQQTVWSQTSPMAQPGGHPIGWPQPSSTAVWQRPAQGLLIGAQHVPAPELQTPPSAHSPLVPQVTG